MKYTNSQIKETAAIAFESNFGIRPKNKDIQIIDKKEDRTYIIFTVGQHLYRFSSYTFHDDSVWCGNGTVEKVDDYYRTTYSNGDVIIGTNSIDYFGDMTSCEKWNPLRGQFEKVKVAD